ncbi:hypothetical protein GCM10028801_44680 [Nocardioides maradonensis]
MSRADLTAIDGENGFDPAAVPMYPMLRAEIREDDDGAYVGLVDDKVIHTSDDMAPVRDAIITAAARTAERRLGAMKAIRVTGQAPDGGVFKMVVTSSGEVHDTSDPTPVSAAETAADAAPTAAGKKGKKRTYPTPDLEQSEKFRPHPLLLVIIAFPLALICLAVYALFFRGHPQHSDPTVPGPRQLPVVAPAGYSPVASWAVQVGTSTGSTTGGVSADATRVYAAAGSTDHITAYTASTGVQEWSTDLGSTLTSGPTVTTVDGQEAVVVATSVNLVALDPATGKETGEWAFDTSVGSQVRISATGPVVTGQSNIAQIIVGGQLVDRVMPAGAEPVGPGPNGSLIAAAHDRVYVSTSGAVSGAGQPLQAAGKGAVTVAGWTGQRLVLAYASSSSTSTGVKLAAYAAPTTLNGPWPRTWVTHLLPATSATSTGTSGQQLPLLSGPAGRWGIYGDTVVNLLSGKTTGLGEWTTVTVGDQIAFGTGASNVLSAGPRGLGGTSDTAPPSTQVTAPQAVVGSSAYLVTAGGGTNAWLYALTPAPGRQR